MISEPMVCSAQTMDVSCVMISTISKWIETRFHYLQTDKNEIPYDPRHLEVPSGPSKIISEPWYVRRKPCTYLASRLALSLKEIPHGLIT
jgi:hypothetical protein